MKIEEMSLEEIKARMKDGRIYNCAKPSLLAEQRMCLELLYDFNSTRPSEMKKRNELLKKMLAEVGEECYIEPPFYANWGGKHIHFGRNVYANFSFTAVDDTDIYIGDYTMIGPNVTVCSATHPISPRLRISQAEYNLPVHIGKNVWLGAGTIVLPGVSIGDNSVIGAGSLVTKDIPSGVVAYGSPCRVIRDITENDDIYYEKTRRTDD